MNYLTNASVRGLLKTRAKDAGSGLFLMEGDSMNGYPVAVSNQVPASTMIFGSFNQLIMGFWGVLDLMVNPYLLAATRYVVIHSTQTVDVAVRHAAAFSASEDIS
jgi:HK97 family phage major capsid protein